MKKHGKKREQNSPVNKRHTHKRRVWIVWGYVVPLLVAGAVADRRFALQPPPPNPHHHHGCGSTNSQSRFRFFIRPHAHISRLARAAVPSAWSGGGGGSRWKK